MATILDAMLVVEPVVGHEARRLVRVSYTLLSEHSDDLVDREISEHIVVHAVDEHDAAVRPTRQIVAEGRATFVGVEGRDARDTEFVVELTDLDVEQDWWSTGTGGEVRPIAEWLDHIAADINLVTSGRTVASAATPTVTGSWGALGEAADEV